ncbi:ParB/RepB/Spo0J family partition protein [Streptomyces sp. NPDC056987]|uniref:ParB/RepB/Spo0J family partition protein n=1 Tax=Streptomyces sp. NPDC056987 TaxID=3345988 RepID=UPI00363D03D0
MFHRLNESGSTVDAEQEQEGKGIIRIRISELRDSDSPRRNGVDPEHVRVLAEAEGNLPPIFVHHENLDVIDGMHRVLAARMKGCEEIDARFFYGSREEAFFLAVKANTEHGLPLTLGDRRAAASRIIRSHPEKSDRSIAVTTGLAARTVASIRQSAGAEAHTRVGRDGRKHPVSAIEGRRRAGAVIAARPDSSLRQIAREAGISLGTARDVRTRFEAGKDVVPAVPQAEAATTSSPALRPGSRPSHVQQQADIQSLIDGLRRDPSVRYTESGRTLLRWLAQRVVTRDQWRTTASEVPPHCAVFVARIARECATAWAELANELEQRQHEST